GSGDALASSDDSWQKVGGASKWWLHHALVDLDDELSRLGSRLILRRGDPQSILSSIAIESGAHKVRWNRVYEPGMIARDNAITETLRREGIGAHNHNSSLLFEPDSVASQSG